MATEKNHRSNYALPRTEDAELVFQAFPKAQFSDDGEITLDLYG